MKNINLLDYTIGLLCQGSCHDYTRHRLNYSGYPDSLVIIEAYCVFCGSRRTSFNLICDYTPHKDKKSLKKGFSVFELPNDKDLQGSR